MGNNYDFRFNPKEPDRERIEQHKDFDALLQQQQVASAKKQGSIRLIYLLAPVIAASVLLLLYFYPYDRTPGVEELQQQAEAYFARQAFVKAPYPHIQNETQRFTVDASRGGSLVFGNGSRLVFPGNAFIDDRGQRISGEVEIRLQEMHDQVDFFIAGIPMQYDSAGQQYQLESAGMLNISGWQDERAVQIAPDKSIQVELVSAINWDDPQQQPAYNIYRLDTASRNWEYQSLDDIRFVPSPEALRGSEAYAQIIQLDEAAEQAKALAGANPKPEAPTAPEQVGPDEPTFDFPSNLDSAQLSSRARSILNEYGYASLWKIVEVEDTRAFKVAWEYIDIEALPGGDFRISAQAGPGSFDFLARPLLRGEALERAQEAYAAASVQYQKDLKTWQQLTQSALQRKLDSINQLKRALYVQHKAYKRSEMPGMAGRLEVINRFVVDQFGIWNCDRPVLQSEKAVASIAIQDQEGTAYQNQTAYLASQQFNSLRRCYVGQQALIPTTNEQQQVVWIVDQDGYLLYRRNPDLKEQALVLQRSKTVPSSETEIRQLLNLG